MIKGLIYSMNIETKTVKIHKMYTISNVVMLYPRNACDMPELVFHVTSPLANPDILFGAPRFLVDLGGMFDCFFLIIKAVFM